MIYPVAALYIDPAGPYPHLAVECYDERRNAETYSGPFPVVAHPPCGPWGRLYRQCKLNHQRELALLAVDQVRTFGAVLEHPADSKLWQAANLPPPGWLFPDEFGGRSFVISQGDFGHVAPKLTWLYAVGIGPCPFPVPRTWQPGRVASQNSRVRHLTPPQLARQLCHWVAQREVFQ